MHHLGALLIVGFREIRPTPSGFSLPEHRNKTMTTTYAKVKEDIQITYSFMLQFITKFRAVNIFMLQLLCILSLTFVTLAIYAYI